MLSNDSSVLVTGGAGFIGSCLVKQLVACGSDRVVNLDKLTYAGSLDSLSNVMESPKHRFVQGDICDGQLVRELFKEFRPRAVMHLAAESHVDRSIVGPSEFLRTNVTGTVQMLEEALRFWRAESAENRERFRFLHVSTDEVYGSLGPTGSFTESTPYSPNSPYSASKAASNHFVGAYHQTYGLPTLISNCSNNYGPYQFPEKLIPLMIQNAVAGKPLPVYGDGLNVRDWLYVDDHCQALQLILLDGRPGEVYNVGGNTERTNLDMVQTICQLVDERCPNLPHRPCASLITFVKDRPGHDRRYAIDATKLKRELGWQPRESLDSGIQKTVDWYLANTDWVRRVSSDGQVSPKVPRFEAQ